MQSDRTSIRQTWFGGLDILRGGAALLVVGHHLYTLADRPATVAPWFFEAAGTVGVVLFFMLSAFLLTRNLILYKTRASEFYKRRFARIAPAYYANVLLLFLFMAAPGVIFSPQGLVQTLSNLSFAHYLTPGTSSSLNVNGALWTLTIEIFLYLTLPFIVWGISKYRTTGWVLLVFIAVIARLMYSFNEPLMRAYFPIGNIEPNQALYLLRQPASTLLVFLLGIALAFSYDTRVVSRIKSARQAALLIMVGMVFLLWAMSEILNVYANNKNALFYWFDVLIALSILPILLGFSTLRITFRGFASKLGKWLGDRSFGLYLWHFPIILVIYGRGAFEMPTNTNLLVLRGIVAVILSLFAAHLSYKFIELPAIAMAKSKARSTPN